MKTIIISIIAASLFTSCVSITHLIQHTDDSYQEVNQELNGKTVTLVKINEEELGSEYGGIFKDSITIGMETITIEEAKEIQIKNHGKGIIRGMGWGLLSGFLVGGVIGAITSKDEESNIGASDETISYLAGAVTGFLLGGIYGGISGVTDYYTFTPVKIEGDKSSDKKE